ncbi:hypothetical protein [Aeromonas caviae]|uniref:hypothetical protein n=1 Tax=Aeromonas caviae TaxID=648 RepID=UPI002B4A52E1|nr:hypothetical protein [Aeromonas caviae]
MDEKYRRFVNEVDFSRQLLGIGLTSLRKANFSERGTYFQALSSISLGLERLMKLCLILDDHNKTGEYTSQKDLKKYGHDLTSLFKLIHQRANVEINLRDANLKALKLLTTFAKSSRYSNIDFITGDLDNDPIREWHNEIDASIFQDILTDKQQRKIMEECELYRRIGANMSAITTGHYDENGNEISSVSELAYLIKESDMLSGYRVLLIIQIIESICDILNYFTHNPRENWFNFLELNRMFANITYGSDSEKRKRKTFDRY